MTAADDGDPGQVARIIRRELQGIGSTVAAIAFDDEPGAILSIRRIADLARLPRSDVLGLVDLVDRRTAELVLQVREGLAAGDDLAVVATADRLAGVASIVGAGRLRRLCLALKEAVIQCEGADARTLSAALVGEQGALMRELAEQIVDVPRRSE